QGGVRKGVWRRGGEGGGPAGEWSRLDRRQTATADRQGADRHLPYRERPEPPRRRPDFTCRRRPSDASRARATADDPASDRRRVLVPPAGGDRRLIRCAT